MQLNGDSRSLAFCPQTAWLTGGASVPPPDFTQFTVPFRERPPFLANQFSFRATTDRTIFILWCRRLRSLCPVDLRRLPRGHAHHHHLEPQGPSITTTMLGQRASILIISSVDYSHVGEYTCRATNPAGSVTYSAELRVNGNLGVISWHWKWL